MASYSTLSSIDKALKEWYEPKMNTQLVVNAFLAQRIEASDQFKLDGPDGRRAVVGLKTAFAGSIGMGGEDDDLPEGGAEGFENAYYTLTDHFATIELTGHSIDQSETDKGSFIRVLRDKIETTQDELTLDEQRQLYGDGSAKLGTVASVSTVGGVTVIVLTSGEHIARGNVYRNRKVAVGSTANPTVGTGTSGARVAATDLDAKTVTLNIDCTSTVAAGQFLFPFGNRKAGGVSLEMPGLKAIVSDNTTVGTLDPTQAAYDFWRSIVDDDGGTPTLDRIKRIQSLVRRNQGKISLALTTPGVEKAIYDQIAVDLQVMQREDIAGGFTSVRAHGMDIVSDPTANFGELYLMDERDLRVYSKRPWHFLDAYAAANGGEGNILEKVPNKYRWRATLHRKWTFGATRRNRSAVMKGLTDPEGV